MKKNLLIGVGIGIVLLFMGYRIYTGIEKKRIEREEETAVQENTILSDTTIFVDTTATILIPEQAPEETALYELNLALCEYNNLSVTGSSYDSHRPNEFEIAKADEGFFFYNEDSKKITFNIKDVVILYKEKNTQNNDENIRLHTIVIECKKQRELEKLSEKHQSGNGNDGDQERYDKLYEDTDRDCIIKDGTNISEFSLIVYHKKHADKFMEAFTKLRSYYTNPKKRKNKE